jgi:hypothetical protein
MFIPPAMRNTTLRIALRCIPVSIFSRRSLLTPYQKIRRWSKLGPLSSPAIQKVVYRHSTCPPFTSQWVFFYLLSKQQLLLDFFYFFCHHVLHNDNNFKSLSSCINSCSSLSVARPNLSFWHVSSDIQTTKWCNWTCVLTPARISFIQISALAQNKCKMPSHPPLHTTLNPETEPRDFLPVPISESLRSWHTVTNW